MPTDFYDFWSPPTPIPGAPINLTKLKKVFTDGGATWELHDEHTSTPTIPTNFIDPIYGGNLRLDWRDKGATD